MDLFAQMTTFVHVVEAGTLSAASRRLQLSLPTVSRQLSALEAAVGGPLLLRTTRKLTLTEGGRRYYEYCLRILREVEAAQGCVRDGHCIAGLLTVTTPVTFGLMRISPHLPSLFAKHPGLRVDLRLEDRIVELVGQGVDLAIRGGSALPDSSAVIARTLVTYQRVVVASPRYLASRGVPKVPDDLAHHDALVHLGASAVADTWRFTRAGVESAVTLHGPIRTNAMSVLRDGAVGGLGVALLPDWLVAADVAAGRLQLLLREFMTLPTIVSAVYRAELRGSQRLQVFVDHLTQVYKLEAERALSATTLNE